jgi:hypothetical protein
MGRKTMRKHKSTKRYGKKNTIKRKYKGGRTPTKLKGNKYFGFALHSPILNSPKNKSVDNESFGFSSSPKRKSTVRCEPTDEECLKKEKNYKRLKNAADNRNPPMNTNERRAARYAAALETTAELERLEEERRHNFYQQEKKDLANLKKN